MLIYSPGENFIPDQQLLGGKAFHLAELSCAGMNVPYWFALTSEAFLLASEINSQDEILSQEKILSWQMPAEISSGIIGKLSLFQGKYFAVRSSAVGEDGADASFAGQLESYLFVRSEEIFSVIKKVWASAFSERVVTYRRQHSLDEEKIRVAVIIQEMIDADRAGVAFAIDPVSGDRKASVVTSVYGLGEGLVSGLLDSDTFTISQGKISSVIAKKIQAVRFDPEKGFGTKVLEISPERQENPSLSEKEIFSVAELCRSCSKLFGKPQDIEWAIRDGEIFLLQSRPVTNLENIPDTTQTRRLWDNSNIIESYSGVTTPLTFSFVRDVYSEVYKEFSRFMGVEPEIVEQNKNIFSMVGLIEGRVYYNLYNWYNVLSLLPMYSVNADFMEQMMGVKEKISPPKTLIRSTKNLYIQTVQQIFQLIKNLFTLPENIDKFYSHLNETLAPYEDDKLEGKSPEELMHVYSELEEKLLRRWRVPIINDFYTMIFFGLLKKIIAKWDIDKDGTLQNDLLAGEGGVVSTEPIFSLQRISNQITDIPELQKIFLEQTQEKILAELKNFPSVNSTIDAHIRKFGSRFVNELKLETVTPQQDPALIIRLIKSYVLTGKIEIDEDRKHEKSVRRNAEEIAFAKLSNSPLKKFLFEKILSQARVRVKNRENLRFERTRVFAVVRKLFLAIGKNFYSENILENPRDIFFLTKEEIFSFVDGTGVSTRLKEIISVRKKEFSSYEEKNPSDRFETFGAVHHANLYKKKISSENTSGEFLSGIGCCPGIIRAKIRIVRDPANAPDLAGCIMVAERTDPGWAPLFPLAKGLLVERGSLLSHSAIVAREMGIPAIVSIDNLLDSLIDGEIVEMDGSTGKITLFREEKIHHEISEAT